MISRLLFIFSYLITTTITIIAIKLRFELLTNSTEVIILLSLLLIINISLYLLSLRPSKLAYPILIHEENKKTAYTKIKILLSGISFLISVLFFVLIFQKINQSDFNIPDWALTSYIILLSIFPLFVIRYFIK
jgi:hypothetical protein